MKPFTWVDMRNAAELAGSEEGRQALRRLLDWLDAGGVTLDHPNQMAVLTLLDGVWGKFAGTARDEMRYALEHWEGGGK